MTFGHFVIFAFLLILTSPLNVSFQITTIQLWSVLNWSNWNLLKLASRKKQPSEAFYKKCVLKTFKNWLERHLYRSLFFNKVTGLSPAISRCRKIIESSAGGSAVGVATFFRVFLADAELWNIHALCEKEILTLPASGISESWIKIKINLNFYFHTSLYSQHSSVIWPVWQNRWVFVYELSDCGFESSCSHVNFRFRACFEQGVPWHSGSYRVWINSEMRTWHDKNIQSSASYR